MKRVLIVAYYFPPCELTPSQRSFSWAKHFSSLGIYPVIITRNWDNSIKSVNDIDKISGDRIIHKKFDSHEVFYIPHKGNLRTRMFGENLFKWIRKPLTVFELLLQNLTYKVSLYNSIFSFTLDYLKRNRDIKAMLITGNPFYLFRLGYLANRKYALKWICDYRDDWTTNDLGCRSNIVDKVINRVDSYHEKKWVRSSSAFTSVSSFYVDKIERLTGVKGEVISNGYDEEDFFDLKTTVNRDGKLFKIIFNGTLYSTQKVECFLSSIKRIIREFESDINITVSFIGLAYNEKQALRVRSQIIGFEKNFLITERISRKDLLKMQNECNLLLMIGHTIKGTPGSKLYEYLPFRKPILVCPTDHDVIEKTLKETGLGIICKDENECYTRLKELVSEYLLTGDVNIAADTEVIKKYSRYHQTKKMADILNRII